MLLCAAADKGSPRRVQVTRSFYQIATAVDSVYEVELPAAVKQLLGAFRIAFSFGISYTTTPLACLGLEGYLNTLIFCMRPAALTRTGCGCAGI